MSILLKWKLSKTSKRHVHQWKETGRVRIPGVPSFVLTKYEGPVGDFHEALEAMHDRTAVHLRCACGDMCSRTLDGWAEWPATEVKP